MQIRLTRKLADFIDGIDLSHRGVGDLIDLPQYQAELLIAEGWARSTPAASIAVAQRARAEVAGARRFGPRIAARRTRIVEHLRHVREQLGRGWFDPTRRRRAEDRIREERHDRFARTVHGSSYRR